MPLAFLTKSGPLYWYQVPGSKKTIYCVANRSDQNEKSAISTIRFGTRRGYTYIYIVYIYMFYSEQ